MVIYVGPDIEFNYKESTLRIVRSAYLNHCPFSGCNPQVLDSNDFAPGGTRDQRRKEVQKMIENLQGRRGVITNFETELRLLTARRSLPIPHELLELIFQYFVHSYGQLPEKLLLVCRTFHLVAINCRALWTDLDPVGQSVMRNLPRWAGTFIQSRVARSNPTPLDLDFTNVGTWEMKDEFVKKVAGIPTLLQRCRSVVISRSSELQFFQGSQPLLQSLTLEILYTGPNPRYRPWENLGDCSNLRSLKLRTSHGREKWPKHLFQQLTQLEIKMPLLNANNQPYHHDILPVATRLQSLTLTISFGVSQPVIHKSLQTLVLAYRMPWMMEVTNTVGEIVCPELRRLEIQAPFWQIPSSIHLRHTQNLSDLYLDCRPRLTYGEEEALRLNEKWSGSIVELLRSISTVKHLQLKSGIGVVSRLVEKIEADPTLCPELVSLHTEPRPLVLTALAYQRDRALLLKLEARISERHQQLRRELGVVH
jgi:hypothetical protein